ncbi:MAG: glutamate--tRNA ligase [Eubacteriales bacterium]|nr:glutamate--tRNA ligase [Eubacteriales bacterium]
MIKEQLCRTRFAPSPTGFMHIGNLRSALYAYLLARAKHGKFILRIEDTDRARLVEGAVDKIYSSLEICGLDHDEGPDIGGPYGPYVQSERKDHYLPYAQELIDKSEAYYCFCSKERLEALAESGQIGYDRHCRDLSPEEVEARLAKGEPYVIRQKMPSSGSSEFVDEVFGRIVVDNKELEDQVLIKSDGYPTYNFANVIDDHEMGITHVLRGSEYLSSTPKYQQLYRALGWAEPAYVHLPLILGEDGKKLSKRHGATSLEDLLEAGYLPEAIVNYIAFLGWSPGGDTREIFSLEELCEHFSTEHINKAPAVFDYNKLAWVNGQYIAALSPEEFLAAGQSWLKEAYSGLNSENEKILAEILGSRIQSFSEIPEKIAFLEARPALTAELFYNKRQKLDCNLSLRVLEEILPELESWTEWEREKIHTYLMSLPEQLGLKTGQVMGPPRLALAGQKVTPGGAIEIMMILGREESLKRLQSAVEFLTEESKNGRDD